MPSPSSSHSTLVTNAILLVVALALFVAHHPHFCHHSPVHPRPLRCCHHHPLHALVVRRRPPLWSCGCLVGALSIATARLCRSCRWLIVVHPLSPSPSSSTTLVAIARRGVASHRVISWGLCFSFILLIACCNSKLLFHPVLPTTAIISPLFVHGYTVPASKGEPVVLVPIALHGNRDALVDAINAQGVDMGEV